MPRKYVRKLNTMILKKGESHSGNRASMTGFLNL